MKDLRPIIFNSTVSAVASKVLIPMVGFIPAIIIGTVAYELNPLAGVKKLVNYVRSLTT